MRQHRPQAAFSIVDVMMGATILVVGLMGLIQAVTIGSEMLATARRQTLAAQILDQEIENIRFETWSTISGYALDVAESVEIDSRFRQAWNASSTYLKGDVVSSSDTWYLCTASHTNKSVTNASYWRRSTAAEVGIMSDTNVAQGATYALTRVVEEVGVDGLREITFVLEWTVKPSGLSSRTYTRKKSAYFGKYGLNLTLQRS